jgi:hypothetical protein
MKASITGMLIGPWMWKSLVLNDGESSKPGTLQRTAINVGAALAANQQAVTIIRG